MYDVSEDRPREQQHPDNAMRGRWFLDDDGQLVQSDKTRDDNEQVSRG